MTCKKTKYSTQQFALDDIERIRKTSNRDVVPAREYWCTECKCWHLTSKPDYKDKLVEILRNEINVLKRQLEEYKNEESADMRAKVKIAERVQALTKCNKRQQQEIKKLRQDNSNHITQLCQLHKEVNRLLKLKTP